METAILVWAMLSSVADNAETVANLILIAAFLRWLDGFRWVTFTFKETILDASKKPTGEIRVLNLKMRKRDVSASSLTNAVSSAFFNGGFLPNDVRQQVIEATNAPYRI